MKIKRIFVTEYKNLKDFECSFSGDYLTALIGNNGSGKSNLLELITSAFSAAKNYSEDKTRSVSVLPEAKDCIIEYELDGKEFAMHYDRSNVVILREGTELSQSAMKEALPSAIMVYYAGETQHQLRTIVQTFDDSYENKLKRANQGEFPGFKFMDCFSISDLPLLLLTAAVYPDQYTYKLLELLRCSRIIPETKFVLVDGKHSKGEADTFWNAKGFVKNFLDNLRGYVSKTKDLSSCYIMEFKDISQFSSIASNASEFFAKLKALKNAGYLGELTIQLENCNKTIYSWDGLSEGEKQLALLLLLTSVTAQNSCLYLFDEFDAYLHLNWQRMLGKMLSAIRVNGHIMFTTHSPATISTMHRESVFIMENGEVSSPLSDTLNRSLDEIMEEHMDVSLRPLEFDQLEKEFRNAIIHNNKQEALSTLQKIKEIVGEADPFFITARIVLERLGD